MSSKRSAKPTGSHLWGFELIAPTGEVCGGGVVVAPSASAARSHARLLLSGGNEVRLLPSAPAACVESEFVKAANDDWITRFSPFVQ